MTDCIGTSIEFRRRKSCGRPLFPKGKVDNQPGGSQADATTPSRRVGLFGMTAPTASASRSRSYRGPHSTQPFEHRYPT